MEALYNKCLKKAIKPLKIERRMGIDAGSKTISNINQSKLRFIRSKNQNTSVKNRTREIIHWTPGGNILIKLSYMEISWSNSAISAINIKCNTDTYTIYSPSSEGENSSRQRRPREGFVILPVYHANLKTHEVWVI